MTSSILRAASKGEMQRRVENVRAHMARAEYAALIVFANVQRGNAGPVRYLSGFRQFTRSEFLVLPAIGAPVLVVPTTIQQHAARNISWIEDVRPASPSLAGTVVDAVRELGLPRNARIGIVGLLERISAGAAEELRKGLSDFELLDASRFYEAVRMVKSAEEIAMTRDTARIADMCLDVVKNTLRANISEREVVSEAYRLLVSQGLEDVLLLSIKGQGMIGAPSDHVFADGDRYIFSLEMSGPSGYWTQVVRCHSVGARTDARYQLLHQHAESVLAAGVELLRPGSRVADVAASMRSRASELGYQTRHWGGHGMGLDLAEPPGIDVGSDLVIQEGIIITLHPDIAAKQDNQGIFLGDTFVVTAEGPQNLSLKPREIYLTS